MERDDTLKDMKSAFEAGLAKVGNKTSEAGKAFQGSIDWVAGELTEVPPEPVPPNPDVGSEKAAMADLFVRRISVQTHLNWRSTVWGKNPAWKQMLKDLQVRNIRSQMSTDPAGYNDLIELGMMLCCGNDPETDSGEYDKTKAKAVIDKLASMCPDQVEVMEGPNEPNHNNPPNWDTKLIDYQKWLYSTFKANPKFANRKVVGPSIWGRETAAYNKLGTRMADAIDLANLHYYTGARPPPIAGFPSSYDEGGDPDKTYTLDDAIREARIIAPGKPVWITEEGWGMAGPNLPLDEWYVTPLANAKYNIRALCDNYNRSVWRTNIYTLIDDVRDPPRYHGMLTQALEKRPCYDALRRTVKLFYDKGPDFDPAQLEFTCELPSKVKRLPLFQKRDGTFLLGLWQDMAESYNRTTFKDADIPPVDVTVDFGKSVEAKVWLPTTADDPDWEGSGSSFQIPVLDELTVIEIAA